MTPEKIERVMGTVQKHASAIKWGERAFQNGQDERCLVWWKKANELLAEIEAELKGGGTDGA